MNAKRLLLPLWGALAIVVVGIALNRGDGFVDEPVREEAPIVASAPAPTPAAPEVPVTAPAPAPVAPAPAEAEPAPCVGILKPESAPRPALDPDAPVSAEACLDAVRWAPSLVERARILDEVIRRGPPEHALEVLEALLDSGQLPGKHHEATSLKLCALSRIGSIPGTKAEGMLVARLAPTRPRPERLLALELLAARHDSPKDTIDLIARDDHDTVVQDRARRALAHAQ